jgi:predicted GIY-YIG superfamily endonuclease
MARRTVKLTRKKISELPDDKPVVYKILTAGGGNNYTGIAKRGRVRERIEEHLPGAKDYVPGSRVQIEQVSSIREARQKERRIIARSKPKHNRQGR